MDGEVQLGEGDLTPGVGQDGHQVRIRLRAGQGGQVEGAIDRRRLVAVMGARDQHDRNVSLDQARKLAGGALDGSPGLGVRVEQVAADEDEIYLVGNRQLDRTLEGRELTLALVSGGRSEVVVTGAEMNVSHVQKPRH